MMCLGRRCGEIPILSEETDQDVFSCDQQLLPTQHQELVSRH